MEIRSLFNEDVEDIRFKIRELQNAAKVAKLILQLAEEEQMIQYLLLSFRVLKSRLSLCLRNGSIILNRFLLVFLVMRF